MNILHGEFGCSHPVVHGHGGKRRRCAACGATWTPWQKRRGRKPKKHRLKELVPIMRQRQSLRTRAQRNHRSISAISYRSAAALDSLNSKPWNIVMPSGQLLLIIDALWFCFKHERWTAYLLAVRSVDGEDAVFLRPCLRKGRESAEEWEHIIDAVPESVRNRIKAMISDSISGIGGISQKHGWILQRCHFHLMARFQVYLGSKKRRISWQRGRSKSYDAVQQIIATNDTELTKKLAERIRRYAAHPLCPKPYRYRLHEVLRRLDEYRSYLHSPELNLPATTNVMESMNSQFRNFWGRARGFRTPQSLERWLLMFVRIRHTMKCRKKIPQN